MTFPKMVVPFLASSAVCRSSGCSTFTPKFGDVRLLNVSHTDGNVVVSHCGFNFISLVTVLNTMQCAYQPFVYLLWEVPIGLFIFINGLLAFLLDYRGFLDIVWVNIFSKSVVCLFISLTVSFIEQKFVILMKSNLWNFNIMVSAFYVLLKKIFPQRHKGTWLFSLKSSIINGILIAM